MILAFYRPWNGAAQPIYPPSYRHLASCRSNAAHWLWSDHQPTPDRGPDDPIPPARTDQPCLRNWHRVWISGRCPGAFMPPRGHHRTPRPLHESAGRNLRLLELYNIDMRLGDGFAGYSKPRPLTPSLSPARHRKCPILYLLNWPADCCACRPARRPPRFKGLHPKGCEPPAG